jgi:hypothetical protein
MKTNSLMKRRLPPLTAALLLSLTGCASLFAPPVQPGDTEPQVLARLGQPVRMYPDGNSHLLQYGAGAFSQYSYMARIGADGRLVSYEQVWTLQNFQAIKVDQDNKNDVLRRVGQPTEVTRYARIPYEAWNYGFKESGVWNSQMTVYFDDQGIVRRVENGPDPRYDDSRRSF